MARKINGKEVATDIQGGMSDIDLMTKYELSPDQLKGLVNKLRTAGLLNGGFKCPSCGYPQPYKFDECPQCGVLVSKKVSPPTHSGESEPKSSAMKWILVAVVSVVSLAVIVGIGYGIHSHRAKKAEQQRVQEAALKAIPTEEMQTFAEEAAVSGKSLLATQEAYLEKFGASMTRALNCKFVKVSRECYGGTSGRALHDIVPLVPLKERIDKAGNVSADQIKRIREQFLEDEREFNELMNKLGNDLLGCNAMK